jgi:hypothetical protein
MNIMRPRHTIAALALALAGTVAAMPGAAGADPVVTATTGGVSVIGTTGSLGQMVDVQATGCNNSADGGSAYFGEFVGMTSVLDPAAVFQPYETQTDAAGTMDWNVQIPLGNDLGTFYAHWYCADGPVTDPTDPSIRWVSPVVTMTITDGSGTQALRASSVTAKSGAKTTVKAKAKANSVALAGRSAVTSTRGVSITMDPDSLPAIDRIGIFGAQAAALKAKVDRAFGSAADVKKVFKVLNPKADNGQLSHLVNTLYAKTAFDVLGGKNPNAKDLADPVALLDGGGIKVQAIENIALTIHNAAWWNAHTAI